MAIADADRHHLHTRLATAIGDDATATLMELLPPVGWADVATRRDLDHQTEVLRAQLAGVENRLGGRLGDLEERTGARIDQTDASIDALEARTTARFDQTDARIDALEARTTARFDQTDARIDALTARMDGLELAVTGLSSDIARMEDRLLDRVVDQRRFMVAALASNTSVLVAALAVVGLG